ncbi:MAG: hypothetical protein ACK559_00615, partial [bacterium]
RRAPPRPHRRQPRPRDRRHRQQEQADAPGRGDGDAIVVGAAQGFDAVDDRGDELEPGEVVHQASPTPSAAKVLAVA